jgi:sigma-E factor negative regulatory protein RseC
MSEVMKETGQVLKVSNGQAQVLFNRTSACGKCKACGMAAGNNQIIVTAQNKVNAKEGDRVEVQFTSKNALTTSAIAYLFPLAMLIAGLAVGFNIPVQMDRQAFAAIMGIGFTAGAFVILKIANPFFKRKFTNVYEITKLL